MQKYIGRICPVCQSLYSNIQTTSVSLGEGVICRMSCDKNHTWTEEYSLCYRGYQYEGKKYNSWGDIENNKEEKCNDSQT